MLFRINGEPIYIRGVDWVIYRGHRCEADGGRHHYREWNDAHYASPSEWEKETLARLKDWGFNMLGTGADAALRHRGLAHGWEINFGNTFGEPCNDADERWIMPGWKAISLVQRRLWGPSCTAPT